MMPCKRQLAKFPALLMPLVTNQRISILSSHHNPAVPSPPGLHVHRVLPLEHFPEPVPIPFPIERCRTLAFNNFTPMSPYARYLSMAELSGPRAARCRRTLMFRAMLECRVPVAIGLVVVPLSKLSDSIPRPVEDVFQTTTPLNYLVFVAVSCCDVTRNAG
jgi:hypothetical protein